MSRMNESMGQAGGGAQEGGAGGAAQLRDAAQQVGQNVREMGSQVRDAAREKYDQLREQAENYYEQGRETAREWQDSLETYVRDQPLKAVLIAAGVGVLLGVIWKRS